MHLTGTHMRIRPRSAIFVSLGIAAALALGACGSDDEEKKPKSAGVQTDIPVKTTEEARKPDRKESAERKSEKKKKRKKRKRPRTTAEAFANLTPSQRAKVLSTVIPGVFKQYGYHDAKVKVAADGTGARVTVSPGDVCGGPDDASPMERQVRRGAPFLERLTVVVGRNGPSLASYVAASCKAQNPPAVDGPVVLRVKGAGPRDTDSFRVRRKRWTITYSNKGSSLGMFVFHGHKLQPVVFTTQKRGTGKKVIRGKGTYKLKIVGPGPYEVVVHDGA